MTSGAAQSNHARLTAAAAARLGVRAVLVLAGVPAPDATGNLSLDSLFGARVVWVGEVDDAGLDAAVVLVADRLRAGGARPAVFPLGGSNEVGARGYLDCAAELADQVRDLAHVVTAVGTGGTMAGLAAGLGVQRVLGIDVGATADPAARVTRLLAALGVSEGPGGARRRGRRRGRPAGAADRVPAHRWTPGTVRPPGGRRAGRRPRDGPRRSPRRRPRRRSRYTRSGASAVGTVAAVTRLLADLPSYVYGTTRLGSDDVPRERQEAIARAAIDSGLWLHTSRQYGHALELLGAAFADRPGAVPPVIVKLGGGSADDVRATIAENTGPLGIETIALGQLSPVDGLGAQLAAGGSVIGDLQRIRDIGLVGRFVLEIFPWTSAEPLAALRAGHLDGLIDGFITYLNPLQRFASNELWDELMDRGASVIAMRTVSGAPVHTLRDVPGAAWRPYLADRAAQVAPVFERSGVASWAEFCIRFAFSTPQVVTTVGSASRQANLDELIRFSRDVERLPGVVVGELEALQRQWSAEVDVHAEPWTI